MARQLIEAIRNGDQLQARNILLSDKYGCIDCQTAKRDGTALFWACAKGFVELVQLLISKGANVNARTSFNSTPLIAAADRNRHHVMRLLLQHGADVNAQTSKGDTACHLAAYRGHLEAVQVLVASGADVDVTNTHFRTPYDEAVREGHVTLLPYLEGSDKIDLETDSIASLSAARAPPHPHSRRTSGGVTGSGSGSGSRSRPAGCQGRRDSCDCVSNQSLSRESSYEDCGAQGMLGAVDADDRLRGRDHPELIDSESLFPSSHPSLAPSPSPSRPLPPYPPSSDCAFSRAGSDFNFTAGVDLRFSTGGDCGLGVGREFRCPKTGGSLSYAQGAEFPLYPTGADKRPYPYPYPYPSGCSERVAFPATSPHAFSFTASSLPFTYSDAGSNDLSLASDRSSAQKNLVSRLNIPA